MYDARRAQLSLNYKGIDISTTLANYLVDCSYVDAINELDDLSIKLDDIDEKWQGDWLPEDGDTIQAAIHTINWSKSGEIIHLPLGIFHVDTIDFSGPPDIVDIRATSLSGATAVRFEQRSKSWEKVKLKTVAKEVANRAGLQLFYDVNINPLYDYLTQDNESDLKFLLNLCVREGLTLKVSHGKLVLFDEIQYETKTSVCTLSKNHCTSYSFSVSTALSPYRACQLSYSNNKGKTVKVTYMPKTAPKSGPILKIKESVDSASEALRVAKNRLRQQNKEYGRGQLTLPGDIRLAAGLTITLNGWHKFDGKYIIDRAKHSISSNGYRTEIDVRKVLGW